jgi:hypothetical protein
MDKHPQWMRQKDNSRKEQDMETTQKHIPTSKFAKIFNVQGASVRRSYCLNGHYLGIRPVKLPNGRLMWPEDQAQAIVNGQ